MRYLLQVTIFMSLLIAGRAAAQLPGYCDCFGGSAEDGSYWYLKDFEGHDLQPGDWVYAAWTGPDGEIDPPDKIGYPTGDDYLVFQSNGFIEYGAFFLEVTTWPDGSIYHPMTGDLIYCRIFDGPMGSISSDNYYADSQLIEVQYIQPPDGQDAFCLFPGDPGDGHTDTPVPGGTEIEESSVEMSPMEFALRQNYPNPFNPVTEIKYCLPWDMPVTLKIYDVRGVEVITLVDDEQSADVHTVCWDAGDLASGVYFCALRAGERKDLKKMVLLR